MLRMSLLATLAFSLCQTTAQAQMSHHQHASEAACEEIELRCASKVTPAFASDGTLWLAWMAGGRISVASSKDLGRSLSTPVQVSQEKLDLDWGPERVPRSSSRKPAASRWHSRSSRTRRSTARCSPPGRSTAGGALPSCSRSRRTSRPALCRARPRRGRIGVRGLDRQAQPRAREAGGQEVRRRRSVLRVVEGRRCGLRRGAARQRQHL